jgi:hypothetical protein
MGADKRPPEYSSIAVSPVITGSGTPSGKRATTLAKRRNALRNARRHRTQWSTYPIRRVYTQGESGVNPLISESQGKTRMATLFWLVSGTRKSGY